MKDRLGILAALLAVQVLLVAGIGLTGGSEQDAPSLLDAQSDEITTIEITDGEGAGLVLNKTADGWQFANGIAADDSKVSAVLQRLLEMAPPWPVANTQSSRSRFEVAESGFQRRIVLSVGDEPVADLYLGTSPGYRRVHARNAESDDIFSVEFAHHEVPADPDEWVDTTLLQASGITEVQLENDWTLTSTEQGWQINGDNADADAAGQLVERLQELRVMGVFDEAAELTETRVLTVSTDSGNVFTLRFQHEPEADEYVVESDGVDGRFTVASYIVEQILVDLASLTPADPEELAPDAVIEATADPGSRAQES